MKRIKRVLSMLLAVLLLVSTAVLPMASATCGVVEYVNANTSKLYLIEGKVTLGSGENTTTVSGGQTATAVLRPKEDNNETPEENSGKEMFVSPVFLMGASGVDVDYEAFNRAINAQQKKYLGVRHSLSFENGMLMVETGITPTKLVGSSLEEQVEKRTITVVSQGQSVVTYSFLPGEDISGFDPSKDLTEPEGMYLAGLKWKKAGSSNLMAVPSTMPDDDLEVEAIWSPRLYNLTINGATRQVAYGSVLTVPPAPLPPVGRRFGGWIWTIGGITATYMPATMPAANVTAAPIWITNTYNLTVNGTTSQVAYGTVLTVPVAPTAPEGKTFGGWAWKVDGVVVESMPITMPAANVTAEPIWITNTYNLTVNGTTSQVAYGTVLTVPVAPTAPEGKTFGGWTWKVDGVVVDAMPTTMPAAAVVAEPIWTTNIYSLTINGTERQVAYGTELTIPEAPEAPEGKTFGGWTWKVDGVVVETMPATMPAAAVAAEPIWTVNSYTLTINGVESQVAYGTELTVPEAPEAPEGKTFGGWTWKIDGVVVETMPTTMPAAAVVVEPIWATNTYTLTINGIESQVAYGTELTVPEAPEAPEGKTFGGWTWKVNGAVVDAMPTTMPAAEVVAEPIWTTNTYTLTINGIESQVAYGTELTVPEAPEAPEGKTFGGWTWKVDGVVVDVMPATMPAAEVVAEAIWTINTYTLTINGVESQVAYGTELTIPEAPEAPEGKTFGGWTWKVDGVAVDAMPATMPAADVIGEPIWTTNTYTLVINGESSQVAYGTVLTIPAAPAASEGKTFHGWLWKVDGVIVASMPITMPAATVTCIPTWTVNTYSLTINGFERQVAYGTELTIPEAPEAPEGKTFGGWTWKVDGVVVDAMPATMPAAEVVAEPIWATNTYTLTINGIESQVAYGTELTVPEAPEAPEGKTFGSWTWKIDGVVVDTMPTTMPAADVIGEPIWTTNTYTLVINGESSQVAYGTVLTNPAAPAASEGKTFHGWLWKVDGVIVASMPITMPAATVTCIPTWTVNTYSLTVNGSERQVAYGTELTIPEAPEAPEGKTFGGWTWKVDGVVVDAMPATMPAAEVVAEPVWIDNTTYTLTINGIESQVAYGTVLKEPDVPAAPEGKSFSGWTWTVGEKIVDSMPMTMPAANVTAKPNWTTNVYTLTVNGTPCGVYYGTALGEPNAPTSAPAGKAFRGWIWKVGGVVVASRPTTMPAADVEAEPIWKDVYTVSFWLEGKEYLGDKQYAEGDLISPPVLPDGYKWEWSGAWVMPGHDLSVNAVLENGNLDREDENLDGINENPDGTNEKTDGTDENLDGTDENLDGTDENLDGTDENLDGTNEKLDGTDENLDGV